MPKFLEVAYFHQYQNQRQELIQNCLLTVPHHLGNLSNNSSTNGFLYHLFSNTGVNQSFVIEDDTGLQDGFKAICKAFGSCNELPVLEFLEGKNFQREFSVQDIIPSSNPDSPLPEILENVDGHLFGKEVEQFVVFDLMDDENDLKTKKIQDQDETKSLEEIESCSNLDYITSLPITPTRLSKKLHPVKITDPFLIDFQRQKILLSHDKILSQNDSEHEAVATFINGHDLSFQVIKDDLCILEEPFNNESPTTERERILPDLIENYHNGLQQFDLTKEDELGTKIKDLSTDIRKQSLEILENHKGKKTMSDLELLCDSPDANCEVDMRNLETPVGFSSSSPEKTALDSYWKAINTLPESISPLTERHFLSPMSKRQLEKGVRDRDKDLDDMFSMTLKVPDMNEITSRSLLNFVVEFSKPCNEDMQCDLEVSLPWDPFVKLREEVSKSRTCLMEQRKFEFEGSLEIQVPDTDLKKIEIREDYGCTTIDVLSEPLVEDQNRTTKHVGDKLHVYDSKENEISKNRLNSSVSRLLERIQKCTMKDTSQSDKLMNNVDHVTDTSSSTINQVCAAGSTLDSFVLLRTGGKTRTDSTSPAPLVARVPPRSIIRAAKVKPSVFKDDTKTEKKKAIYKPCEREPITPKQVEEHEKVVVNKGESIEVHKETKTLEKKPQIITVELSAVYQAIIERLEKDSRPLLGFLRERKIISNENQFFNLKPDITRFLIRQEEKKHENSTANANDEDVMNGIVCLHALVLSTDTIVNLGLPAAAGVLQTVAVKYNVVDLLDPIQKQLKKMHHRLTASNQLHPKIEKLIDMIAIFLRNPEHKILILVRRHFESCFTMVKAALDSVTKAAVCKYPADFAEEGLIYKIISKSNVIVAELSSDLQFCPWHLISHVFEFEFRKESEWFRLCFEENPQLQGFFAFECVTNQCSSNEAKDTYCSEKDGISQQSKPMTCFSEHILIGSRMITDNKELLVELENRLNLSIVERDYSILHNHFGKAEYYTQPDIIVDERTCIMLLQCHDNYDARRSLQSTILSIKLKCQECYVIVTPLEIDGKCIFPFDGIESLANLLLASSYSKDPCSTRFHLLYTFSYKETADWILSICNKAKDTSAVWEAREWSKRFWLTEEMSDHEKFLLSFPYFTSFTAQIVLTAASLKTVLGFTLQEMKDALHWIPSRIIEAFHADVNEDFFEETVICPPFTSSTVRMSSKSFDQAGFSSKHQQGDFGYASPPNVTLFDERYGDDTNAADESEDSKAGKQNALIGRPVFQQHAPSEFDDFEHDFENNDSNYWERQRLNESHIFKPATKSNGSTYNIDMELLRHCDQSLALYGSKRSSVGFLPSVVNPCFIKSDAFVELQGQNNHSGTSSKMRSHVPNIRNEAPKWKMEHCNDMSAGLRGSEEYRTKMNRNKQKQKWCGQARQDLNKRTRGIGTPSTIHLTPSKKKRLGFEKDPSSSNGQTRLTFI